MFFSSNTTHFTLYVDGLEQDQNSNKPIDQITTKTNNANSTLPIDLTSDSGASGFSDALSGIGDKLSSLSGGLTSLDPFTALKQANELKTSLNSLNNSINDNEKPKSAVDRLQILSFSGVEGISSPYAFELVLVNEFVRFDVTTLLSKPVFLAFTPDGRSGSGIHGIVQSVKRGPVGQHYAQFSIVITPRFTNLMRRTNQRKFVQQTTPDIIKIILEEHGIMEGAESGFEYKLKETYPVRDFCVQYDESDYSFVSRLCEEEGIAYSFTHSANAHKMIFTDAMPFFPSIAEAVKFMNDTGMVADTQALKYFDVSLASRTQTAAWRDYNFKTAKIPEGSSEGKQSQKGNEATEPNLEYYDYPSSGMDKARNDQLAKVQIERLRADHLTAEGYSDRSDFHSGYYITIDGHPSLDSMDAEKPWLITQIKHKAYQPQVLEAFGGTNSAQNTLPSQLHKYLDIDTQLEFPIDNQQQGYFNVFNAIPQEVSYRPALRHPKPKVLGSQTAVVTGPAGEEIYCDEYGRVKIQLHWDREGSYDENSSYWVRVASNWAHDGYGTVVIPRVGMEVMVDFLEGDPDQPMIKGAIHNGVNKVPYDLPANKTRSVFKTSSSKGGVGSNELRIEDKAGQEQIFVQAQKDFDHLTKNNHTVQVLNNSHLQVQNEHSETIVKNRYQHQQSEEHHLTQLDRKTQILQNDHTTVGMTQHTTVGTVQTIQAGQEVHLKAGMNIVIDGGLSLTLKAGGQHIVLNPTGIWMTMPVWTGGVPMEGTPSAPLLPMANEKAVEATVSPKTQLAALMQKKSRCLICEAAKKQA
ncbi:type VI secretion system tip protein VgrG [Entomomonas sp. E2T0]|uniref:type VI secretion system tip protein TssI/VgrG n=1 Tax=Entomomonas sp. E2T0 TaxID=2930213 RepID=UPI0022282F29|nr:type VI secretion system tip protein TssI/VgrG [Entomomonas sp. E2T0]UYZ85366.1 type VI secretion system tip protein VgrG [Entomomonas sp. E2T0]